MEKNKFVNNNLVKIRDRLASDTAPEGTAGNSTQDNAKTADSENVSRKNIANNANAISNERDWKKALFRRWDDFKALKQDITTRLAEQIASIPPEIENNNNRNTILKQSAEKFQQLLEDLEELDDSQWNRHTFSSELASGFRKLEKTRIQFMMQLATITKSMDQQESPTVGKDSSKHFIHELNSLSFSQCFRIGFAFFMPLILGILLSVIIFGVIYYFSLH